MYNKKKKKAKTWTFLTMTLTLRISSGENESCRLNYRLSVFIHDILAKNDNFYVIYCFGILCVHVIVSFYCKYDMCLQDNHKHYRARHLQAENAIYLCKIDTCYQCFRIKV